jgi:hypothetical protein
MKIPTRSNAARQAKRLLMPFVGLFTGLVLLAACQTIEPGDPALPNGFLDAGIPDVELSVYAYVDPGYEITVPVTVLAHNIEITEDVGGTRVIAATHTDLESLGARVDFNNADTAELVLQIAEEQAATSPTGLPWLYRDGRSISVVEGETAWAKEMQEAFVSGATVNFQETYPETWEVMRLLPADPPAPAVAAGFVRNVSDLIEGILQRQDISAPGLDSALGLVRVDNVAFAAYANHLDSLPTDINDLDLEQTDMGVIAVAKAGYPGLVINAMLNTFASRAGLEDITIGDEEARYRNLDNKAHLVLKNFGGVLYFALSPTREGAERLIQSVIDNAS